MLLSLYTGFRAHEALAVQLKHFCVGGAIGREIALPRRALKCGKGKYARTVSGRRVPIHPLLRQGLEDYLQYHLDNPLDPESYLFVSRIGENRPISVIQAWKIFTGACEELGIRERVALHSMRKSFARAIHEATHDLLKTQRIMGHSNPMTTVRYLESTQEELDSVVMGLGMPGLAAAAAA